MKYTIIINQLALQRVAPSLDITDATILDYLIHFCSAESARVSKMTFEEAGRTRKFIWINYSQLIRELPMIKIKSKSAISNRIAKIEKAGFIKTRQEFGTKGRLYVLLTKKIQELFFSRPYSSKRTPTDNDNPKGVLLKKQVFSEENIQHNNKIVEPKGSTEEAAPLPGKKKKGGDPRIRQVIGFFISACEEIKGFKPRVEPGVSGALIERYLREYSVEEITDELDWFLNSKTSSDLSCTIKVALSNFVFNKWLAQRQF